MYIEKKDHYTEHIGKHGPYLKMEVNKLTSLNRARVLEHLPKGMKIAEIGVFTGGYSKHLYEKLQPSEFFLIDCWRHITEGTDYVTDGCNAEDAVQEKRYQRVAKKYGSLPGVQIIRELSRDAAPHIPDGYLDGVYIDGDHSYAGCLEDLRIYSKKVKEDGFLFGHDYTGKHSWIQVPESVETFVDENPEWRLHCVTAEREDWCPTFFLTKRNSAINPYLDALETTRAWIKLNLC